MEAVSGIVELDLKTKNHGKHFKKKIRQVGH